MNYTRDKFNLLLGERTAEDVKISIGAAYEDVEMLETKMRGRDVITGLPREVTITSDHVREALAKSIRLFCDTIKDTVEETPPELVADVYERGILLTGGGALIRGLDVRIQKEMQIPVRVAEDPLTCVVRGTGRVLENFDALKDIFVLSTQPQS